jgi:hypothetical protein
LPLCLKEIVFVGRDEKSLRLAKIKLMDSAPTVSGRKIGVAMRALPAEETIPTAANYRGGNLSGVNGERDCLKTFALQ